MFELNGEKVNSVFLTEEEKIVINAMRSGAKAEITFNNATFEEAKERTEQIPKNVLEKRYITDLTHGRIPFINICAADETIQLNHFVEVTRKVTDSRQA